MHFYKEQPFPISSPQNFAHALDYEISRITKTLLLKATDQEKLCLVVASSNKSVNFDKVAEILKSKRVQLANQQMLSQTLAYLPKGVSPIGTGSVPVLMDEGLMHFLTVLIGAGKVRSIIKISPQSLKDITNAVVLCLGL